MNYIYIFQKTSQFIYMCICWMIYDFVVQAEDCFS